MYFSVSENSKRFVFLLHKKWLMTRKIISYNVNGLRAAIGKNFDSWIATERPDILCVQETKIQPEQINGHVFESLGYYQFWHSAVKKGYSGTGILTKFKPDKVILGLGNEKYDSEGRVIRMDFADITIVNVYIPSGTMGGERQEFKMQFLSDFKEYISTLLQTRQKIVISGDFNICHKSIDINHPERHQKSSGFLPEERAWFDDFLKIGLVDSFREFNKEPEQYSWWSYRAGSRSKNLGWRIDYNIVSEALIQQLINAGIHQHIIHSDHCPVIVEIDF